MTYCLDGSNYIFIVVGERTCRLAAHRNKNLCVLRLETASVLIIHTSLRLKMRCSFCISGAFSHHFVEYRSAEILPAVSQREENNRCHLALRTKRCFVDKIILEGKT